VILKHAWISGKGPRPENQDSVGAWPLAGGGLAVSVADGLGGQLGGSRASRIAVEMFGKAVSEGTTDLGAIFQRIHIEIKTEQRHSSELRNMATTLSAVALSDQTMNIAHCGDTRVVLQRGNGIRRLTKDQTETYRLFEAGKLTREEYRSYPRKNILESALGIDTELDVQCLSMELFEGDRVFLSSDGFHSKILLRELKHFSDRASDPDRLVNELRDLVEERGPDDNYTLAAIFVE
jgi:protein phosphatase